MTLSTAETAPTPSTVTLATTRSGWAGDDVLTTRNKPVASRAGNDRLPKRTNRAAICWMVGWAANTIDGAGASMVLLGGDGSDELNAHGNPVCGSDDLCAARPGDLRSGGAGDDTCYEYQSWNGSGYETGGELCGGSMSAAIWPDALTAGDDGQDSLNVGLLQNGTPSKGAGADSTERGCPWLCFEATLASPTVSKSTSSMAVRMTTAWR